MKIFKPKSILIEILEVIGLIMGSIGAIASVVLLAVYVYPRIKNIPPINFLISGLAVVIVVLIIIMLLILRRKGGKTEYGRQDLIRTGQDLIRRTKSMAILFAGDMSWTDDYISPINEAFRNGKKIEIFYFDSGKEKVRINAERLSNAGATLIGLKNDPVLRATLIDPDDPDNSVLFLPKRTIKGDPKIIHNGEPGTDNDSAYLARIQKRDRDPWLFDTVIAFYKYLDSHIQAGHLGS